jgi:hypothetical protein
MQLPTILCFSSSWKVPNSLKNKAIIIHKYTDYGLKEGSKSKKTSLCDLVKITY